MFDSVRLSSHKHNVCVATAKARFTKQVSKMGKVISSKDEAVLNILLSNHRAFSAYDITEIISNIGKRVQPIQIYRSLEKLMKLGVVHRLSTLNSFIACYGSGECSSRQFLICTGCDSISEMHNKDLETEIQSSARSNNFFITTKAVEVLGLCHSCHAS